MITRCVLGTVSCLAGTNPPPPLQLLQFVLRLFLCHLLTGENSQDRHVKALDRVRERALGLLRLFYGCSCRLHLSGDNSRDRHVKGLALAYCVLKTCSFVGAV